MHEAIYDLAAEIRKMNAAVNVYDSLLNGVAHSELEKQNHLLKLQLLRDDILRANMNIKRFIKDIQ